MESSFEPSEVRPIKPRQLFHLLSWSLLAYDCPLRFLRHGA
jgi:hypothetical protein